MLHPLIPLSLDDGQALIYHALMSYRLGADAD
jgi:hypothetical protein